MNVGSFRGAADPGDVVCLVKRYISDGELSQAPLLVLPLGRADKGDLNAASKQPGPDLEQHIDMY